MNCSAFFQKNTYISTVVNARIPNRSLRFVRFFLFGIQEFACQRSTLFQKVFLLGIFGVVYTIPCLSSPCLVSILSEEVSKVALSQRMDPDTTIHIEKAFISQPTTLLIVESNLPVHLTLVSSESNQIQVLMDLRGKGIQAEAIESITNADKQASTIAVTIRKADQASYISSSTIRIAVPRQVFSRLQLEEGQVYITKIQSPLTLGLTRGDLVLHQIESTIQASVGKGSIMARQSILQGSLQVQSGILKVEKTTGSFSLQGPCGQISIQSPTKPVEAYLQKTEMTLTAIEANVTTAVHQGIFRFTLLGNQFKGQKLAFQATDSELYVHFPEGFSMDLSLDQNQSAALLALTEPTLTDVSVSPKRKGRKMKFESEFTLTMPTEKEIIHQGKKMKVAQSHQILAGGENKVSIHSTDSEVYIKKSKAGK